MKQTLIIAIGISAMLFSCKNKNTDVLAASKDSIEAAKIQEAKMKTEADAKVTAAPVVSSHSTTTTQQTTATTSTPVATTTTTTTTTKKKGWSKTAKGAVIGAASGAVIGAIVDKKHPGQGAVLGGAVGAAAGAVIGSEKDKKDGRK